MNYYIDREDLQKLIMMAETTADFVIDTVASEKIPSTSQEGDDLYTVLKRVHYFVFTSVLLKAYAKGLTENVDINMPGLPEQVKNLLVHMKEDFDEFWGSYQEKINKDISKKIKTEFGSIKFSYKP